MTGNRTIAGRPGVVSLDDGPREAGLLGAKARNLASARAGGLPVVDGFVIPPGLAAEVCATPRGDRTPAVEVVRRAWGELSRRGSDPVVVRSSSTAEDTEASSQAGVFDSVVDVRGWDDFLDAVRTVAGSAERAAALAGAAPLAILVQRHVDPLLSGVMFTVDPVSGRADHLVVAFVDGGPQALVSGEVEGTKLLLDRHARVVEGPRRRGSLRWHDRLALVRLARRAEALFGGPQDIEWALDAAGRPLLLQSRPITSVAAIAGGPVFGPGPIAETFPDPLRVIEQDLWLTPLREALRVALALTGAAPRRVLERSPIVIEVGGRPAIDLDLLEAGRQRRRGLALLDPRQPMRHLRVAWQVGRLRSGLSGLIDDVISSVDGELAQVPGLDTLDSPTLVRLLERTRSTLQAAHGYELLAGALAEDGGSTGAAAALSALDAARRTGASDTEIVATRPVVLALTPPAVGPTSFLPPSGSAVFGRSAPVGSLGPREALRLRIRWLHELSARAAWALGERLTATGQLRRPSDVTALTLTQVAHAVRSGEPVEEVPPALHIGVAPLPARFQLRSDGSVAAVAGPDATGGGTPAGGGRGTGIVEHRMQAAAGAVLVVETLDPRLAPILAGLAGLVAETGSPLSHLAILAREHGVPTVVGLAGATRRFPPGTDVLVDGSTGEVRALTSTDERAEAV